MLPRVLAGYRTLLKVNNETFAAGFVLDYAIDTVEQTIQAIDNVFPDEIAPQMIGVTMTMRVYRTPDNDPISLGIAPPSEFNSSAQQNYLSAPYIQIEVRDKVTEKTILYLQRAWLTRRVGNMESVGLLTETWTIKSIGFIGPNGQPTVLSPF